MKNDNQPPISYLDRKIASLLIKLKNIDIKKFKLKEIKKEYYMPLAIAFGAIIISIAIYLGSSAEYRVHKNACIVGAGEKYKTWKKETRKLYLSACISRMK